MSSTCLLTPCKFSRLYMTVFLHGLTWALRGLGTREPAGYSLLNVQVSWLGHLHFQVMSRSFQISSACLKRALESPVKISYVCLDCGRKPEHQEKTHTGTGRTWKLHTGPSRSWGSNPKPSWCEVPVLTTAVPCHPPILLSFVKSSKNVRFCSYFFVTINSVVFWTVVQTKQEDGRHCFGFSELLMGIFTVFSPLYL